MYIMGKYYNYIPNDETENNIPCYKANMNIPWPRFLKSKDWLQTIRETKCLNYSKLEEITKIQKIHEKIEFKI